MNTVFAMLVGACATLATALNGAPSNDTGQARGSAQLGSLLIVHTTELSAAATAWSDWRLSQGWKVTRLAIDGGTPEALQDTIRAWAASATIEPRAVLLLGSAAPRAATTDLGGIPTFHLKQRDPAIRDRRDDSFASDGPYQDLDDDGAPDLMLGRVPVSSDVDARIVLDKIRSWETMRPGDGHRRVELVGGEGRFGPYDTLLEVLTSTLLIESVPAQFELRASYAKATSPFCPPPSRVRSIVREQALSGAILFNYVGHGHATGLDSLWFHGGRARLLEAEDLRSTAQTVQPTASDETPVNGSSRTDATAARTAGTVRPGGVALLVCCSVGWYDDPSKPSLAHTLLLEPSGPIAVFAGSRPTHPYANAIVERDGVRSLLQARADTVGAWDLAITRSLSTSTREELDLIAAPIAMAQRWPLSLRSMRRDHALLYNLIGDPTTRLVHAPSNESIALTLESPTRLGGRIMVAVSPATRNSATEQSTPSPEPRLMAELMFMARRTAAPRGVIPASGPDDPQLESITARNWPRANDWVRWRAEAAVQSGAFAFEVPDVRAIDAESVVVIIRRVGDPAAAARGEGDLEAMTARDRLRLIRSWRDEQGLPADRRAEPR